MILFPHLQAPSAPRLFWKPVLVQARPASLLSIFACLILASLAGCSRLQHEAKTETVYVLAKQTFLRDRVAAVSNRVATVQNGDRLVLVERGRRFLKVKTEKGEIGWIEEHAVVNPEVVSGFEQLRSSQARDPVVATAVLRDDGYLHLKPGRDTDRYYLLPEGDKLQLLLRASVPKAVGPQASSNGSSFASVQSAASEKKQSAQAKAAQAKSAEKSVKDASEKKEAPAVRFTPAPPPPPPAAMTNPQTAADAASPATSAPPPVPPPPPPPIPMEDWWLVRDSRGRVGWIMSRRIDVDVPDEIAGYAEGQRIVAAYLLRKVEDPESNFPDKQAPEYLTVLCPYQDGLPYDFNQVRVFTWNLRKHRYETAFRQRNLQGYLPVVIGSQPDKDGSADGSAPTFQFQQGVGDAVTLDPETGASRPNSTETLAYVLEGETVRKAGLPPTAPARARTSPEEARGGKKSAETRPSRAKHRHKGRRR